MINKLIFEGGGVLGISYAGVITRLHSDCILDDVNVFMGTSVGSIVASFLAVSNGNFLEVSDMIRYFDYNSIKKGFFLSNLFRFFKKFGYYDTEKLGQVLCDKLDNLGVKHNITFKEVYDIYGKELFITVTNITKKKVEVWSRHTKPDMSIVRAMIVSSSIPVFFKPYQDKETKDLYCDGGLIRNYNIEYFKKSELDSIMGFIIRTKDEYDENNKNTFKGYLGGVFNLLYNTANFSHIKKELWDRTCEIKVKNFSPVDFDLTDNQRYSLYMRGLDIDLDKFEVDNE